MEEKEEGGRRSNSSRVSWFFRTSSRAPPEIRKVQNKRVPNRRRSTRSTRSFFGRPAAVATAVEVRGDLPSVHGGATTMPSSMRDSPNLPLLLFSKKSSSLVGVTRSSPDVSRPRLLSQVGTYTLGMSPREPSWPPRLSSNKIFGRFPIRSSTFLRSVWKLLRFERISRFWIVRTRRIGLFDKE